MRHLLDLEAIRAPPFARFGQVFLARSIRLADKLGGLTPLRLSSGKYHRRQPPSQRRFLCGLYLGYAIISYGGNARHFVGPHY